ncbi:MAG: histidine kinase dimerization/phospho-acceptor domain-containing protein [Pseudomonadota bacterium]
MKTPVDFLFGIVAIAILAVLGGGIYAFRTDFNALRSSTQENIIWSANQLEFELSRFMGSLAMFAAGSQETGPVIVNRRFDVLWSRVQLFDEGDAGRRLSAYDGEGRVAALFADMQAQEAQIVGLKTGDAATARVLLGVFAPHARNLRDMSLDVLHGEESNRREVRENVRTSAQTTIFLTAGALVLLAGGMVVLFRQNRRLREFAAANLSLAQDANAANLAKSRFMSMMSHELRTPLNGVLGLLSLVKQSGLPRPQLRLVEQAERSGRELTEMLTDVLDYSSLADAREDIDRRAFLLAELCAQIKADLLAFMRREGMSLDISVDPEVPARFIGDQQRLRKAVSRLSSYIIGTAGAYDLKIEFQRDAAQGELIAMISFRYGNDGSSWLPELVLGAPNRRADQFASDALGPAVARLIVERMHGRIGIESRDDGTIAITVAVPADAVVAAQADAVLIDASSQMVKWICRSAIAPLNLKIFESAPEAAKNGVSAVLMEAGSEDETPRFQQLRREFPTAIVIAIGMPLVPGRFDAVCGLPPDPEQLRGLVLGLQEMHSSSTG